MNVFCFFLFAGLASAVLNIDITDDGSNVNVAAAGSLDVGTPGNSFVAGVSFINGGAGRIFNNPGGMAFVPLQAPSSGPLTWGISPSLAASSSSGDRVFLDTNDVLLDLTYVNNSPLSFTQQYNGQTLASLNLVEDTYVYTITATGDTINVCIGPTCGALPPVPPIEPTE